jgi:hypothetical protein
MQAQQRAKRLDTDWGRSLFNPFEVAPVVDKAMGFSHCWQAVNLVCKDRLNLQKFILLKVLLSEGFQTSSQ